MNYNQLKKDLDAYLQNFFEGYIPSAPVARTYLTSHKMMVGETIPEGLTPDFLFIDTGIILDPGDGSYMVEIPNGYNYSRAEVFSSGITENVTVTEDSENIIIAADPFDVVRVILKFEISHIDIIPAPSITNIFVDAANYLTVEFSNLMNENANFLNPQHYNVFVNNVEVDILEVSSGINNSILSIVIDGTFSFGDVVKLSIDEDVIKNIYGTYYPGILLAEVANLLVPAAVSIEGLEAVVFDFNNSIGIVATVDTQGIDSLVKIVYGYDGLYDEIELDPIVSESGSVVRTIFIPKEDMGSFNFKMVLNLANGSVVEKIGTPITVYAGVKNTFKALTVTPIIGDTFYIDPSASSNGAGTELSPFNALPDALGNSATYLIKKGTTITYDGPESRIGSVGTCKIGSYGLTGARPKIKWINTGETENRFIDATSMGAGTTFVLDGIFLESDNIFGIATYFANSPGSCINNCEIKGFACAVYAETHVFSPYPLQWSGLNIWYSKIHGTGLDGINARNVTDLKIEFTMISDVNKMFFYNYPANISEDNSPGDGIQVNSSCRNPANPTGARIPQVTLINNCTIDRSSTGNKFCIMMDSYTSTFAITNNRLIGQRTITGANVSALYLGMGTQTNDNLIRNNVIENCSNAFAVYCNGIFAYNKVLNCGNGLIVNASRTQKVYNNVFYNLTGFAVNKMTNASVDVRNNVYVNVPYTVQLLSGGTNINSHNHFVNSTVTGTNSSTGDPLFKDAETYDFRINTESPLIESGVDVSLTTDFEDNVVAGSFNKGLYAEIIRGA